MRTMNLLRKIYNKICGSCKKKVFHARLNQQRDMDLHEYCQKCQEMMQPYEEQLKRNL